MRDPRAPFIRRWLAGGIDILLAAFGFLLANRVIPESVHTKAPHLGGTVALLISIAYFWVPEAVWGCTPGKWLTRVRVVDALGCPPGPGRALVRTLLRLVEVNPLLFGGLPAAAVAYRSKTGQRLGDTLAKTYVLRVADLPGRTVES